MNFRNISAWSIRNPVVPIVLFAALLLGGMVAFSGMKVQQTPDIEFPMVIVQISQPGAAPSEIENQITQRIESAVRTIAGVDTIQSSTSEGSSQTQVMFKIGTDVNAAVGEVKNAVDQARGGLPDGILEPQVFKAETSSQPIAYFSVVADDMTIEQLSWFIDDTVAKRLLSIPGMAEVGRGGGVNREIAVTLHPDKMQALGVTASQINSALRSVNVNAAGGRTELAGARQSVRVLGNAKNSYDLSQTEIAIGGGRTVKLSDVADVRDDHSELTSIAKINGRSSITFSIARSRGESDVSVYDGAIVELDKLQREQGNKVRFTPVYNSVDFTKAQYESSMSAMIEGAILAVIVVFFFLRDWRATIVAALAIPLSAIPTFLVLSWLGFTLNQLSLLALGLVAGVLVDDAIVEIENIVRHMRMGKSAYQASIDAADEIGLAVVATTFSIVAVFLPVALMPGIPGQFFKNFGLTVVVAVLFSLLVARMITPMVAAYFLKAHGHAEHGGGVWMDRYMAVLRWSLESSRAQELRRRLREVGSRWSYFVPALVVGGIVAVLALLAQGNGMLAQSMAGFLPTPILAGLAFVSAFAIGVVLTIAWGAWQAGPRAEAGLPAWARFQALRGHARLYDHRIWMIGIAALALVFTALLVWWIPKQFFPDADGDYSAISIEMVPGTTLDQTERVVDQVYELIRDEQEVKIALQVINEGRANLYINLRKDRERTSLDFEREMTPVLQRIPDARVTFMQQNGGGGGGGGSGRPISVMLSGSNPELLQKTAQTLVEQMSTLPLIVAPRISADLKRPEIIITPNLDLAASLGVTTQALSQAIRIATLGEIDQNSAKFSLSDRQVPIRVKLPVASRQNLGTIENLPVPTASGGSVPLSRVATISFGSGPTTIQRYNLSRRIFVGADLAPGVAKGNADVAIKQLPIMRNLPAGVTNEAAGQDRFQQQMISAFVVALATGVLLVFSVLVLLYHRFVSPLVNMSSLFLAPLGGLILLAVTGNVMSLPVFIGVLMLFGIVAKNSILLIDFAIEEMAAGVDKDTAIIDAGHKRAQPIVMTTVAMVAGMIPTAITVGGDTGFRAPMGLVVIGGLILSTALTLLIVPAAFSLADGLEKRLGPKLRSIFLTYNPGDDQPTLTTRGRRGEQDDPAPVPAE